MTEIDCGALVTDFRVLPFVNSIENDGAVDKVEVIVPPFVTAALVAAIVHTEGDVWEMDVISVIPVRLKSTPAVMDNVEQLIVPFPVNMNSIAEVADVAVGVVRTTSSVEEL